jgi:Fanconi anemia group D2 protein
MCIALDVLQTLAESHTEDVLRFVVFIKNILDCMFIISNYADLDNLNHSQIRVLFSVFSTLAFFEDTGDRESLLGSELNIFIRKQLSSSLERYKMIGVISTLCLIKKLGSSNATPESLERTIGLLDLLLDRCKNSLVWASSYTSVLSVFDV